MSGAAGARLPKQSERVEFPPGDRRKYRPVEPLLLLDVDRDRHLPRRVLRRRLARAGYRLLGLYRARSPGGKGWHLAVRVAPHPRSPEEVVALQAILGSDPLREASNLLRARALPKLPGWARRHWSVLYESVERPSPWQEVKR